MTTRVSTKMINQTGNITFTGSNVSLGAIGNLHITGGSNGQFITTDGTGNLSFGNVVTLSNVTVTGNIIPSVGNTYSLGNTTNRFKDLYLEANTIYLGNTALSATDVLPFDLNIAPEVLSINADGSGPGNDIMWLWTWEQSTLPYARTTITNQQQIQVPLYKLGTYQVNNFANEQHGNLDARHLLYLKWVDGAGTDNLVSWSVNAGNVTHSHPNINGGVATTVQRLNISVPSTITIPTLNLPSNVAYNVAANGSSTYSITGSGVGENRNIGPLYRGATYTFNLDTSLANHPFYITTDNGTAYASGQYVGEYTTGVTGSRGNGQAGYNTLTFTVPNDAPDVLYYQCGHHSAMRGAITIKNLAVETNNNGNYVLYFQHGREGHKTPVEIRPIPSLVNQMCLVYDANTGQFVPQDLATYVENTPSFFNKIQEVAGTATLIAPDGAVVVPTVLVVEDVSYLPLVNNNNGDLAFDAYTDTIYVWETNSWRTTKPNLSSYATQSFVNSAVANLVNSAPATLDTLNELATALGNDASFSTTLTNSLANKLNTSAFTYANITGAPTLGNISTINLNGNANTVLRGDGTFGQASGDGGGGGGGGGTSVTVSSTAPSANTSGALWYDNINTGELYVYDGGSWVSTSIIPMTNTIDPTLSGVNQANENANITITITNYSNTLAYQVTTTSGTTSRSNASIYWQLPSVVSNTAHTLTVQAVSGSGVASSIVSKVVTILNTSVADTAIIISDFGYNDLNTGWVV